MSFMSASNLRSYLRVLLAGIVLIPILILIFVVWKWDRDPGNRAGANPPKPETRSLVFKQPVIDIGRVYAGLADRIEFPFTNLGSQEVRIRSIQSSCQCTDLAAVPSAISPHKKGRITGTVRFGRLSGQVEETFLVATCGGSKYILKVKANVADRFVVTPQFVDWGTIYWDDTARGEVHIRTEKGGSVPNSLEGMPGHFSGLKVATERKGKRETAVTLTLDHPPVGLFLQRVLLKTKESNIAEITIPVRANVVGPVSTHPPSLYLGPVPRGKHISCMFNCVTRPGYNTTLESVSMRKTNIPVRANVAETKTGFDLEIMLTLDMESGLLDDFIVLKTKNPEWSHNIPIVGYVEPCAGTRE